MSNPVFYFVGGEDLDYQPSGNAVVSTAAGTFDSSVSRCSLNLIGGSSDLDYWRQIKAFSVGAFWFSANLYCQANASGGNLSGPLAFWDSAHVIRLRLRCATNGSWPGQTFVVDKVNAAGSATTLGSAFQIPLAAFTRGRIDIQVVYAVAGSVAIYVNGQSIFSYSGDVTTDGATALAGHDLRTSTSAQVIYWSQIIISDSDTRSFRLETLPPVANGNTHNFDIGSPAAANVNEIVINDATLDGATAAGLIDQYTIGAILAGSYAVAGFAVSARLNKGFTGPTRCDLGVRSAGADYWGADQALNYSFTSGYQTIWNTDPATSAAWINLPTNIGLKAVA